jgi:hypothetical protein
MSKYATTRALVTGEEEAKAGIAGAEKAPAKTSVPRPRKVLR